MHNKHRVRLSERKVIDQYHALFDGMIKVYHTSTSICGYVVCAMADYFGGKKLLKVGEVNQAVEWINESRLSPYVEKPMESIQLARSQYCADHNMKNYDCQNYLRDWVANYEIEDYLHQKVGSYTNRNVYFFRFCSYDFPQAMERLKHEEKERVVDEIDFKGQTQFVTMFEPFCHLTKQAWKDVLVARGFTEPVIIITDLLGHFTTLIYFEGQLRILDSMKPSYLQKQSVKEIHRIIGEAQAIPSNQ